MIALRKFRQSHGVSQDWLAQKMGIHRITLARYELGKTDPPESFYYHVAYIFRLPVEEVIASIVNVAHS